MSEDTEQKPAITLEDVQYSLLNMHEVAAAMKQCNPNMNEIRAPIFDRWRTILWESIPIVQAFIEQMQDGYKDAKVPKIQRVIKVPVRKPRRILKPVR